MHIRVRSEWWSHSLTVHIILWSYLSCAHVLAMSSCPFLTLAAWRISSSSRFRSPGVILCHSQVASVSLTSEWWSHALTIHIIYYCFLSSTCIITMCLGILLTLAFLRSTWPSILIRRLQASLVHSVKISVTSQWYYSIPLSPSSSLLVPSSCLCTGRGVSLLVTLAPLPQTQPTSCWNSL